MVNASASLGASATNKNPLPTLLRRYHGTRWDYIWDRSISGLLADIEKPGTRSKKLDLLGQPAWSDYPAPGETLSRPRLWVEAQASLFGTPIDDEYSPIGILFKIDDDLTRPGLWTATFVIPFGGLPVICSSRVLIDSRAYRAEQGERLSFADLHRARLGAPLSRDAIAPELLAHDDHAVLVDEQFWIRTAASPVTTRIKGVAGPHYAIVDHGPEGLRAAHAATAVEAWKPPAVVPAESAALANFDIHRLSFTLFRRVLARGPYLALTALALAAESDRAAA